MTTSSADLSIIPIRPDEIPKDLICAICLGLPAHPVVTVPCEHIFCRDCLQQALRRDGSNRICPVDRTTLSSPTTHRSLREGSVLRRIWANIPVKCAQHDKGCAWTGPISDYLKHEEQGCAHNNNTDVETQDEIIARLKQSNRELRKTLKSLPKVDTIFNGSYDVFTRENVVNLSRLVARYLEDKPSRIDANLIFTCVQHCYRDFEKGYRDNPAHYHVDVHMLLTTCAASNWFTDNQFNRIRSWLRESDWY